MKRFLVRVFVVKLLRNFFKVVVLKKLVTGCF